MSQGKPWTEEERANIIPALQPYLEAGLSRNKACEAIGLAGQTLCNWVKADESLGMKLKGWENSLNILAMQNIADALALEGETEDTRKDTSKWYLERRMKNEFSLRTEHTGEDGAALPTPILTVTKDVHTNDSNEEDSSTG